MKRIMCLAAIAAVCLTSCSLGSASPSRTDSAIQSVPTEVQTTISPEATKGAGITTVPYEFSAISFSIPETWKVNTGLSPTIIFSDDSGVSMSCEEKENPYPGDLAQFNSYVSTLRAAYCKNVSEMGMAGDISVIMSDNGECYYLDFEADKYWYHFEFDMELFKETVAPVLRSIIIKEGLSQ